MLDDGWLIDVGWLNLLLAGFSFAVYTEDFPEIDRMKILYRIVLINDRWFQGAGIQ